LLLHAAGRLPWRVGQWVGGMIGALLALSPSRAAGTTAMNLRLCFPTMPPAERRRLARESLRATGKLAAETAALWVREATRWECHVRSVHGAELVDGCIATGVGVLVLAPHHGNWELLNCLLGARYQAAVIYEPQRNARIDAWINRARATTGSEPVPTSLSGLRRARRRLLRGGVVGLLPDQVPERASGVHVPFFGVPTLTMTLVHGLLRGSPARAVLASAQRNGDGTFDIVFEPLDEGIYSDDTRVSATTLNHSIEGLVRRDPTQYQWEYKRFKRPPSGMAAPY
jgi:KDO2-lipid IV(A) lauroyltransferase